MKKLILFVMLVCFALLNTKSQTIDLTFTAIDNTEWIQIDSIKVMNRTRETDTVLYWPDTMLSLNHLGFEEIVHAPSSFRLYQNYPNPFVGQTRIKICVIESDIVIIMITDALGRKVHYSERVLNNGCHEFMFRPGNTEFYFLTAIWNDKSQSIKILNSSKGNNQQCSLEYQGTGNANIQLKSTSEIQGFPYTLGDRLLYIGYAGELQSGLLDIPEFNQDYTLQFATNIPCPGTPSVEYDGQIYNTIQIFNQCWLKENLNVGTMIQGDQEMTDNSIVEKYCYNNEPGNCARYGGLYQWNEMMQYTTQQDAQGICPTGWHIPTDEEWKVLEGAVDSLFGIGDQIWEEFGYRGLDGGTNLKSMDGWDGGGNGTDKFGFSVYPNGIRYDDGSFLLINEYGLYWSSEEDEPGIVWYRFFDYQNPEVLRGETLSAVGYGYGVRCIKD